MVASSWSRSLLLHLLVQFIYIPNTQQWELYIHLPAPDDFNAN